MGRIMALSGIWRGETGLGTATGEVRAPAEPVPTYPVQFRGGTMAKLNDAHPRRRAYGEDLRRLAVTAVLEEGMSLAAAGRRFGVSEMSVADWVKRWRERGHLRADARGGDRKSWRIEAERERIFSILERQPALTVRALRDRLAAEGVVFGSSTVQRFLERHGLRRERRLKGRLPDLRRKRAAAK